MVKNSWVTLILWEQVTWKEGVKLQHYMLYCMKIVPIYSVPAEDVEQAILLPMRPFADVCVISKAWQKTAIPRFFCLLLFVAKKFYISGKKFSVSFLKRHTYRLSPKTFVIKTALLLLILWETVLCGGDHCSQKMVRKQPSQLNFGCAVSLTTCYLDKKGIFCFRVGFLSHATLLWCF